MTIWHFKGELLEHNGAIAVYRFYPDDVMAPDVSGVFHIDLVSFEVQVVESANAEARGLVSTDKHCISALVHKIRKTVATEGVPPAQALFVA